MAAAFVTAARRDRRCRSRGSSTRSRGSSGGSTGSTSSTRSRCSTRYWGRCNLGNTGAEWKISALGN